jgi:hypothetical protein
VSFLRRWQARHLLVAWIVYWVLLIGVSMHSAIAAAMRALNAPHGLGSISASVDKGNFVLKASVGADTWSHATSLTAMTLWFAGPPLLLFLVWLVTRRAPVSAREADRDYRIS